MRYLAMFLMMFSLAVFTVGCGGDAADTGAGADTDATDTDAADTDTDADEGSDEGEDSAE